MQQLQQEPRVSHVRCTVPVAHSRLASAKNTCLQIRPKLNKAAPWRGTRIHHCSSSSTHEEKRSCSVEWPIQHSQQCKYMPRYVNAYSSKKLYAMHPTLVGCIRYIKLLYTTINPNIGQAVTVSTENTRRATCINTMLIC